ncbi:BnaA03g57910D [Brassica napus]|uniref:BnaA03g57910D protein n=1 Tax=Brassica napus TaxID=3708 RepID=A0A078JKA6_BRANA|nr:BnaA03g57910D [Brassica napus]
MAVISEIMDDDNGDKKPPQEPPGGETRIITRTWPMVSNVRIDFVTYAVVKQRIYTLSPRAIWCVEIGLRRRQGGEIRGKVESVDVVFKTTKSTPSIELSRTVIDKGRPLPKFGEWDVNDPSSAEGFTVIFNKARNEKKGGGVSDSPRKDEHAGFNKNGHVLGKPTKKWFCCIKSTRAE